MPKSAPSSTTLSCKAYQHEYAGGCDGVVGTLMSNFGFELGLKKLNVPFARAKVGPKAPLATLRLQVKDLPANFSLNDSMARSGVQLSTFPAEVVVGARISKSGSPMPQSGDLQGFSQPVMVGASGISVVIDQQLP